MAIAAAFDKPQAVLPVEEDDDQKSVASTAQRTVGASPNEERGMVLPFEPHSITFDDIRYSVDMPQVSHTNDYL